MASLPPAAATAAGPPAPATLHRTLSKLGHVETRAIETSQTISLPPISLTPRNMSSPTQGAATGSASARGPATTTKTTWRKQLKFVKSRVTDVRATRPNLRSTEEVLELRRRAIEARSSIRHARAGKDWVRSEAALDDALGVEPNDEQLLCERSTVRLRQRKITGSIADAEKVTCIRTCMKICIMHAGYCTHAQP